MCQDSLSSCTGSDAVLDGLEVLGDAFEEDNPRKWCQSRHKVSPLQWNTIQSLNLTKIPIHCVIIHH